MGVRSFGLSISAFAKPKSQIRPVDVVCLGELLVDLIGQETGSLADVQTFRKHPGGSAANVAVGVSRLGLSPGIVTRLGTDPFGDYLIETMNQYGVDTSLVRRDKDRRTTLAFVSLDSARVPDYVFYRHPSACMYLTRKDIDFRYVAQARLMYTSSISLVNRPIRDATYSACRAARRQAVIVGFDVNLRTDLWRSLHEARRVMKAFLRLVDILKIDHHELDFLYPGLKQSDQLEQLFREYPRVRIIAVTLGADGVVLLNGPQLAVTVPALPVNASRIIDTTGAGDAFMAALLTGICRKRIKQSELRFDAEELREIGRFANTSAALVIQRHGAIPAMPTQADVEALL